MSTRRNEIALAIGIRPYSVRDELRRGATDAGGIAITPDNVMTTHANGRDSG